MKFNKLIPELSVTNIDKSKEFYLNLGFKIMYERKEDKFAFLELEGNQLMIEEINDEFEEEAEEIYPRNTYHALFGVFLPIEDVVEGYKGESISELEEELKNGELGVPKINLEGHEIEFIYPEEDSPVNPDNVE